VKERAFDLARSPGGAAAHTLAGGGEHLFGERREWLGVVAGVFGDPLGEQA
jgi:hypothetical protein